MVERLSRPGVEPIALAHRVGLDAGLEVLVKVVGQAAVQQASSTARPVIQWSESGSPSEEGLKESTVSAFSMRNSRTRRPRNSTGEISFMRWLQ